MAKLPLVEYNNRDSGGVVITAQIIKMYSLV